jgi:hypothetical protein
MAFQDLTLRTRSILTCPKRLFNLFYTPSIAERGIKEENPQVSLGTLLKAERNSTG